MAFERRGEDLAQLCARFAEVRRRDGRDQAVVDLIGWLCWHDRHTLVELLAVALSTVDADRSKELLVDDQDLAVAFVRARLDELETRADAVTSRRRSGSRLLPYGPAASGVESADEDEKHAAVDDPGFVLRDVAAKREILDIWEATRDDWDRPHPLTVRLPYVLASAWNTHPDYRQSWAY